VLRYRVEVVRMRRATDYGIVCGAVGYFQIPPQQ